jgi:hypothetical protein
LNRLRRCTSSKPLLLESSCSEFGQNKELYQTNPPGRLRKQTISRVSFDSAAIQWELTKRYTSNANGSAVATQQATIEKADIELHQTNLGCKCGRGSFLL